MKNLCKTCVHWDTGGRAIVTDRTQAMCKRYPTDQNSMKHAALDGCGEHEAEPAKKEKVAAKKSAKKPAAVKKAVVSSPPEQEPEEVSTSPDA